MTLVELAEILNVSASSISRALTRPDMVSPAMRARVLQAVEQYGYSPNGIARSLRKGETKTVGLVVSDLQNPFYSSIAKFVEHTLSADGYSCVVCDASESQDKEQRALRLLAELKVSGVIRASSGRQASDLTQVGLNHTPIVEIDRATGEERADTVLLDNVFGAKLAVEHLVKLGHRRVAMISGPEHLTTGGQRLRGYREALAAAGIEPDETLVEFGDFREESGYEAARRLLRLTPMPTALFVANNEMMAGALYALKELGLNLPADVSLISFDDARWARYVDPPLTVVAQPLMEMGEAAAHLLLEQMSGRERPTSRVFTPTLIVRASTGSPRPEGTTTDG